jgi:hypothetical protein
MERFHHFETGVKASAKAEKDIIRAMQEKEYEAPTMQYGGEISGQINFHLSWLSAG